MKRSNKLVVSNSSIFTRAASRLFGAKGNLLSARVMVVLLALVMSLSLPAMFESSAENEQELHERKEQDPHERKNPTSGKKPTGKQPPAKKQPAATRKQPRAVDWTKEALIKLKNSFVEIPAGEFMMGSENGGSDEKPVHRMRISRAFEMSKYEVTQAQWQAVMGSNPSRYKGLNLPVENVSWNSVQEFIRRLNASHDGNIYRLPTEAEWEYACRAGTTTEFAFGETITPKQVNYDGTRPYGSTPKGRYRKQTIAVGSLGVANAFGLYDMPGNVWEWCSDWYDEKYYKTSPIVDPEGPQTGLGRVYRGGGWNGPAEYMRSAFRGKWFPPVHPLDFLGFRLVRTRR